MNLTDKKEVIFALMEYNEEIPSVLADVQDVENSLKRLAVIDTLIEERRSEYKKKLAELTQEYNDVITSEEEETAISKKIVVYANKNRLKWNLNKLVLKNGILEYTPTKGEALYIGIDINDLAQNMKEFFNNSVKYLEFINVTFTPKKNEIKTAIKENVLSADFCNNNKLSIGPGENFNIKTKPVPLISLIGEKEKVGNGD